MNKNKTGVAYKLHTKYCKDKQLKPVTYSTFTSRLDIGWDIKRCIFTPHQGWGGKRNFKTNQQ